MEKEQLPQAATFTLEELQLGQETAFEVTITASDVDAFAALSGDYSPLHVDDEFARSRGFEGRVVHGALLVSLISRLVGMHMPGRNCLWQGVDAVFVAPAYIGSTVRVTGKVDQLSETSAAVIKVWIVNVATGKTLVRAKAIAGLTKNSEK